jgi:hypothetical protein
VVPTFYDSIEINKDRAIAKFHRRSQRWTAAPALLVTLLEALLTIVFVRWVFRMIMLAVHKVTGRGGRQAAPEVVEEERKIA